MAKDTNIDTLLSDLSKAIDDGRDDRVSELSDKILDINSNDTAVFTCKVVSLIRNDRAADAVKLLDRSNVTDLSFERAYCLYRTNKLSESLEVLKKLPEPLKPGALHAQVQVLYRLSRFSECIKLYERLLPETPKEKLVELKTNSVAVLAMAGVPLPPILTISQRELDNSYELAYNLACLNLELGNLGDAERLLKLSQRVCQDTADDDETDDEIANKMAVLEVQMAYLDQITGNRDEAMEAYTAVLKAKQTTSDAAVVAVASNNVISLKQERNLFDSLRKSKSASSAALDQKLSARQKLHIAANHALVLCAMNRGDLCREILKGMQEQFGDSDLPALIQAALFMKEKKFAKAEECLRAFADRFPEKSARVLLTLVQLQLSQNNNRGAITTLQSIGALRGRLGIVGALVRMYEQVGEVDEALSTLETAIKQIDQQRMDVDSGKGKGDREREGQREKLLSEKGHLLMKHGRFKEAASAYEQLHKLNQADARYLYGLVVATARSEPDKAEQFEARLPPMPKSAALDADVLENVPPPRTVDKRKREVYGDGKSGGGEEPRKKKPTKKRKRLPKNFDPNVPPDPERWLPRSERTHGKKGKQKKKVGTGTQGSTSATAGVPTSSSFSGAAPGPSSQTPSTSPPPPEAPVKPSQPSSKGKKKKK
mmetsp:Transcript_45667/g.74472  ORF Transcript_45667/g.74472 Transcript_45667/m.74472 type:complete len:657 (+) Transcript_45667:64-2034(+)|eukprot:CAMPEP_0184337380 /NCGR_PEP_ID=MMETSP1089-20130417/5764_1 /TAXON_ID=38269 ORGANISM="Gloeochaete wittrockiana, Strain SAG46.84" /NCGR_SAMPLE_ID=MMETSP1089 /ASSEMBLY_ACC=CAM_ASM_000445 /LENGTH=656 /DNA_ID=CAMNT_0026663055 /DNA_START=46 /DNA_END=2016 /DNA_ORIENTATION=-